MKIKRIIGGNLESNCYIIYHKDGGDCLVIDPGYTGKAYDDFIKAKNLNPIGIILTHHHRDHTGAVGYLSDRYPCPVMMHRIDSLIYKGAVDYELVHNQIIDFEGEKLQIINTPGHTGGSICIMAEKSRVCFTGDTIFDTDLGRTDLFDGSERNMRDSVMQIINKWDNDITIYPGHDGSCNMKFVRKNNKEFIEIVGNENGH